ncbi:hypothetical protein [Sporosarcina koreensis]|uniref:Uncharacterized protein n=1 Tax=Sporosarcina koreensis TaxID=334735 RepID=A0ABW0TX72_9BACL
MTDNFRELTDNSAELTDISRGMTDNHVKLIDILLSERKELHGVYYDIHAALPLSVVHEMGGS